MSLLESKEANLNLEPKIEKNSKSFIKSKYGLYSVQNQKYTLVSEVWLLSISADLNTLDMQADWFILADAAWLD